jgi:hypothetical protein
MSTGSHSAVEKWWITQIGLVEKTSRKCGERG